MVVARVGFLESPLAEIIALRLVGAFGGGFIALWLIPSTPWRLKSRRMFVSLTMGVMLEPALRNYLEWPPSEENIVACACIIGAVSWWAAQGVIRLIQIRSASTDSRDGERPP